MKASNFIAFAGGAAVCFALYACGGDSSPSSGSVTPPSVPSQNVTLSPADVLSKAQTPSEFHDPLNVNNGQVTLTPVNDESSDPLPVNK